jgi:sulfite reductase (NADPH) hemoprotein beta-component
MKSNSQAVPPLKPTRNETLKAASPTLAGTIGVTLADPAAEHFSEDDCQFLKFHGVHQGDDRDLRKTVKKINFQVVTRMPGGRVPPEHYLTFDRLATEHGNNSLRITSRQSLHLQGLSKAGLGPVMKGIHETLASTLATGGDAARNVMAPPTPATGPLVGPVQADARRVSDALLPRTPAYQQIWGEGRELKLPDEAGQNFVDPLYGQTYLPRKFKIAFAIPPLNDVDVFTNCLGFVAIADGETLAGYNLLAGGGLGMSFGNPQTYARLADVIGFLPREHVVEVAKAVMTLYRDFGDRTNRQHARLKYLVQEKGLDWFRSRLHERLGFALQPARPFQFTRQGDLFGWHAQPDGNYFLGLYIENGRITDTASCRLKTALRIITGQFKTEIRLTPSQNLLLTDVTPADRGPIDKILAEHGVPLEHQPAAIRRAAMACPALPSCGRALAEAERMFPELLTQIENLLVEAGLSGEEIIIRATGCPNSCDRSRMAEIGLIGKVPGKYHLYLGGNQGGTQLNELFKEGVKTGDLAGELRPLFLRFARERHAQERFGDFCRRVILKGQPATA